MPRTPDPDTQRRYNEMVRLYRDEQMEEESIAMKFGVQEATVRKVLRQRGIKLRSRSRSLAERRPLTGRHVTLGVMVANHRSFQLDQSRSQAAKQIPLSPDKLSELEQGYYDPKLIDLYNVAAWMNTDVPSLLTELERRYQRQLDNTRNRQGVAIAR